MLDVGVKKSVVSFGADQMKEKSWDSCDARMVLFPKAED